jgi:prepilin-type N-terminal cleavage/methylation domain-containing protein
MKKLNRTHGGFTLIELLVVIAIIGILSSVVLVSLNSARKKGTDTRVISDVQETRTALESGYTGGVYPDLYNTTASGVNLLAATTTNGADVSNINQLALDAVTQGGALSIYINTNGNAGSATVGNAIGYAIYGQLTSNSARYFCIDSTGATNQSAIAHASSTCPIAGN